MSDEDSSFGPAPPPPGNEEFVQSSIYSHDEYDIETAESHDPNNEPDIDVNAASSNMPPPAPIVEKQRSGPFSFFGLSRTTTPVNDTEEDDLHGGQTGTLQNMPNSEDPIQKETKDRDTTMVTDDELDDDEDKNKDNGEDDDDESVEIPPTTIVQRMIAQEKNHAYINDDENGELKGLSESFRNYAVMGVCCLVIVAIVLASGFGTGAFSGSSSESSVAPPTESGNSTNVGGNNSTTGNGGGNNGNSTTGGNSTDVVDPDRASSITEYLSDLVVGGSNTFENETSPEGMALGWLINEDPLQLGTTSEDDQFRLRQRYALLCLWFNSRVPWTTETNWLSAEDECTWFGLECALRGGGNAVTSIDLSANSVQGTIPSDVSLLSHLSILNLGSNNITGSIPDSVSSLTEIQELDLSSNNLSGDITEAIGSMTNITVLRLSKNNFTQGEIPVFIYTLKSLEELDLDNTERTGSVSQAVGSMSNLRVLKLDANSLTGNMPDRLSSLTTLERLDLSRNAMTGNIPSSIGDLVNLQYLALNNMIQDGVDASGLTGPVPTSLANLTSLEFLDLSSNLLSGSLPESLGGLESLSFADFSNNDITGSMPTEVCSLSFSTLIVDCDVSCSCCTDCVGQTTA